MQIGLIGLGTMGANLARNAARNGARVSVYNRTPEKTDAFMAAHGGEGDFVATKSIEELVQSMQSPRAIVLMVKAGEAVDEMIDQLLPHLSQGDILIDAGNSHNTDTDRRVRALAEKGMRFVGMGVSGGEEGALHGPSMMPGGNKDAYMHLEPLLMKMAADDGADGKCVTYIGEGGAGHFVKTVHNGIEYGIMQLIAESYDLLKRLGGLSNAELAQTFDGWSKSNELRGFLMEITTKIFTVKDPDTGNDLLDMIKDTAAQKGTGKWTTESAFNYGVSVPTITAGVDARIMSSAKEFRVMQAKATPLQVDDIPVDRSELLSDVRDALELSMLNVYAQGLQLITEASKAEGWNLNVSDICRIWRGGCIIRSSMTEMYQKAFAGDRDAGLALRERFNKDRQVNWRRTVALGALRGIPLPAMSSTLWYYDSYRTERLPQNLIQAQRDFFGAHEFQRTDKEGSFHHHWI
jgi:6-phosphogluconate dehydrogenase